MESSPQEQIDPREQSRVDSVAVGTTAVMVCEPRTGTNFRKEVLLRNISSDPTMIISVSPSAKLAVNDEGIVLRQNESVGWSTVGKDQPYQGAITAICAVAAGTLAIYER